MEITLTAQIGGQDASKIFSHLVISLRKSLKLIQKDYSTGLDKFKIQMRISGEVSNYKENTGIHYVRLMKTKNYVSGEIILGKEIWREKTTQEIILDLCYYTEKLFLNIIDKLKKNKILVENEKLISDLKSMVFEKFKKENL
ncbi:Imm12 family immunity protein [Tenacibaculum soleae]|uniref:Imm12 family immunity protein n=1 Tax=Tenacibaculum soleae TaxID=447689 RepID=UPI0023010DE0|nr:Imm12 family immunity protein [Tenacibaculum soleae]